MLYRLIVVETGRLLGD